VLSFATMATVALAGDGSATVQYPFDRVIGAAADAGFRGVALDWFSLRAAERAGQEPAALAAKAHNRGMVFTDLSALGLGPDDSADEPVARSMARRCAALGISVCGLVITVPPSATVYERLARCAEVFSAADVRLALEFVPYTAVRCLAEARSVCERVGPERCGVLVDSWHLARGGGAPAEVGHLAPREFDERARRFALRRGGRLDEIVGTALYLASDASSYTTGAVITVDGGQP